jgi:hypothetical protein
MNHPQTIARVFGVLYLITFITSILAFFFLYAPVLNDPNYIVGAGADTLAYYYRRRGKRDYCGRL